MDRVILHSDLNNFYASVECMLHPELKDKCVAVCGSEENRHGIVLAKNEAAKKLGLPRPYGRLRLSAHIWKSSARISRSTPSIPSLCGRFICSTQTS